MHNRKNFISSLVNQIVHTLSGLIIPRLMIASFGSEVNGLVTSIGQFLSFISLLEGGLGAVVLAELYKPIEDGDKDKIKKILIACQKFFTQLSVWFVVYTIILTIVYSLSVKESYSISFTSSLIIILAWTTVAQYLFSITQRLYLQATQKLYIVNNVGTISMIGSILLTIIMLKLFPEIRLMKLVASLLFFLQPFIYNHYVGKEVNIKGYLKTPNDRSVLRNRWSGFAQNLSHFINVNTDVMLITFFSTFANVSVYTVHLMAANAIRNVLVSIISSYQSALGKYIAQNRIDVLRERFFRFTNAIWAVCIVLFCTCLQLINPFVTLYTKGVNDANYYQPLFALIIVLATFIYCIREPFRFLILAAGKFKETNFGSIMEAALNIIISVVLVNIYGLVGVAIGTFVAISYRMIYFMLFLKKNILHVRLREYLPHLAKMIVIIGVNIIAYYTVKIQITSIVSFVIHGILIVVIESIISGVFFLGIKESMNTITYIFNRTR